MRRFKIVAVQFILVFVAIVQIPTARAADRGQFIIIGEVGFARSSGVTEDVRAKCTLQTRLPRFVREFAHKTTNKNVVLAEDIDDAAEGQVLHMEFVNITLAAGGGTWSNRPGDARARRKSVTVKGTLTNNGEVIGTFIASRYSTGGFAGGFKGPCSILGRCIKKLGSDIAKWLANPTMDAKLGNA